MRKIILIADLVFFFATANSQALDPELQDILQKSRNYFNKPEKEFIYTQFNKAIFFPGENVWFKTYILNSISHLPFLGTKNLYVELFDPKGKLVLNRILYVEKGTTFGNILLADSLPAGIYTFKAYTNWSRNFGEHYYFTQTLSVLGNRSSFNESKTSSTKKYSVEICPEGGHLISELENKAGFKIVNKSGYGIAAEGYLKQDGHVVQEIIANQFGIGHLKFIPNNNSHYSVVFYVANEDSVETDLPQAFSKGVTLSAENSSAKKLIVTVNTNAATFNQISKSNFYLFIHQNGSLIELFRGRFGNKPVMNFEIPKDSFPPGVCHITLFDSAFHPIADRAFFSKIPELGHIGLDVVREKDSSILNITTKETSANVSVSILPAGTVADHFGNNIISRYFLEADVKGFIENPAYYFESSDGVHQKNLDDLLLVQGWRSYEWNEILNAKKTSLPFAFEQGFSVEGYLPGKKEKDELNVMLLSSSNGLGLISPLDSNGHFKFPYLFFQDSSTVYLNATDLKTKKKFKNIVADISKPSFDTTVTIARSYSPSTIDEAQSTVSITGTEGKALPTITVSTTVAKQNPFLYDRFATAMDRVYEVDKDNVNRYHDLIELLSQEFLIRFTYDSFMNIMADMGRGRISFLTNPQPILVIDDVPMPDLNALRDLSVTDIEAIAVNKTGNPRLGSRGAAGSIVVKTRKNLNDLFTDESLVLKKFLVRGYSLPSKFYSPQYNVSPTDIRFIHYAALHWEPEVITDSSGKASLKFFLPEEIKNIKIRVEGINKEGKLFFYEGYPPQL